MRKLNLHKSTLREATRAEANFDGKSYISPQTRKQETQETSGAHLRLLIVAPSLDILGGQSRQAVRLLTGLQEESALEVAFLPHNPRLPRIFRRWQGKKYVRSIRTTLLYWLK